jgi:hypothetical protein
MLSASSQPAVPKEGIDTAGHKRAEVFATALAIDDAAAQKMAAK